MKNIKPVEVHNVVLGAGATGSIVPDTAKYDRIILSVIGTVGQVGGFMIDPMPAETTYLKILANNTITMNINITSIIYIKNYGDNSMEFSVGLYRDRSVA